MKKGANTRLESVLLTAGFSQKEADVYMALLDLGKGTVTEIARKAGINRTTGYDILDNLVNMGVVAISGKEPKQEYTAERPEAISKFMSREIEKKREALKEVEKIVPELTTLHNRYDRAKVLFYEGTQGLETVYEDTLSSSEEIRAFATVDDMHRALPHYFPKYYKRRAGAGISIRAIIPKTPIGIERKKHDKEEARETAFVPPEKFYFSPEINIYDNKVMIASLREKLGIIIESAEIADAMKKIYELAWSEAKRLDKEN